MCPGYPHKHDTFTSFHSIHIFPRPRLTCFGACAICSPARPGPAAARPASIQQLLAWALFYRQRNWLETLCVHCFRFILLIKKWYDSIQTIMLVEFLNIKHSHSHCEWYTLIKRQFCDQLLSVAYWTFALISYETVTVRDHEQLRPGHQSARGRDRPHHYAAQHQGGGAGGEVVRWLGGRPLVGQTLS